MADKLIPLKLPGGIYRNGTTYQAAGRWFDGNLVRFRDKDVILPVGGWRRAPNDSGGQVAALAGIPRGAAAWEDDSGSIHLGLGTTQKLYALAGGVLHDISPIGLAAGRTDTTVPGTLPGNTTTQGSSLYGHGPYGSGTFGQGSTLGVRYEADVWQLDSFGMYLVAVTSADGKLYVWQGDPATPAEMPADAPVGLSGVVTTPERFLFALGADGNVRKVAWATQETIDDWEPMETNSAGDFELATDGRLMCGHKTRKETILLTDADAWVATYIGGELIYRFDQVGDKCGVISRRAAAAVGAEVMWMGRKSFFRYDGYVRDLPSEVHDYVFSDMNETQAAKIWSMTIAQFGEVWWFYPSAASMEIDRYVAFNYRENLWHVGRLARTAGVDTSGVTAFPIMCKATGEVYEHETGTDREGVVPFLESGPVELGDGDRVMTVLRYVPDEKTVGDVALKLYASFSPTQPETLVGPYTAAYETPVRVTARQVRVRLDEVHATDWRVGRLRLGVAAGGMR